MTLLRHVALLAVLASTTAAAAACSTETPDAVGSETSADTALGHVHGLGVDPGDGTLYVASHVGVFRVQDGVPERVADRRQDTMGFAVVGPGHFLGSGHPDLRDDLPSSLGLIESTDSAETWSALSLEGEADFHAIEAVGDRIYAYDARSGSLLMSTDRRTWESLGSQPLFDLAADPDDPSTIYATTDRGVLVESRDRAELTPVPGAPTLTSIDWEPGGPLVGVAPDGTVLTRADTGSSWDEAGALDGFVEALDATPGRWHAATGSGLYESTDDGATWDPVLVTGG